MLEVYFTLVKYKELKLESVPKDLKEKVRSMLIESGITDYE